MKREEARAKTDEIQMEFEHLLYELMMKHNLSYLEVDIRSRIRQIKGTDGNDYPHLDTTIYEFGWKQ
jgi:hypothetical protein